jgi:hypothetical protein
MSAVSPPTPAASQQAAVEAALLLLERMGLSPADLVAAPKDRAVVPTFAEYVPVVSAAVSAGTRRAYGSYWNRIVEHWGARRLDEPTPSDIRQLMTWVKTHVVARRNARGGRSAQEHLVAALRCLYRRAVEDGLISQADDPARKVAKPRRLPSTRRAVPEARLAEINQVAASSGDDRELDTLLLRLHTETACLFHLFRRGRVRHVQPSVIARLDPLRLHCGKDQASYHRLVCVPADQQVALAAGDGQHGGLDRQGTAAGGKEGLLRADCVRHQLFGPGQVAVRRRAVIQPGRG